MHKLTRTGLMALLLVATFALVGCGGAQQPAADESADQPAAEASTPEMVAIDPGILADSTRPADDVAQDADRKPIELYQFFGVQPGMTVADIWPGAGYNTQLLSRIVGDSGKVYAAMGFYAAGQYATMDEMMQRVADAHLTNVDIVNDIPDVPAGSLDFAVAVRNYHDAVSQGQGPQVVAQLFAAVKPGGVVGIVDVATDRQGWDEETHRLNEQAVINDFTAGGFELEGRSDMLANPNDDHSTTGFEQGRQTMDRYVLKFRKPAM